MLNHISFACSDIKKSTAFYDAVLAPLGFVRVVSGERFSGYSHPGSKDDQFAIKLQQNVTPPGSGFHLAFTASNRIAVDEFYKAAIANGGRDNGKPGLRPHYGPTYYAAFIVDLDGYPIEAVCHAQ